jgi:hypothetical protein
MEVNLHPLQHALVGNWMAVASSITSDEDSIGDLSSTSLARILVPFRPCVRPVVTPYSFPGTAPSRPELWPRRTSVHGPGPDRACSRDRPYLTATATFVRCCSTVQASRQAIIVIAEPESSWDGGQRVVCSMND